MRKFVSNFAGNFWLHAIREETRHFMHVFVLCMLCFPTSDIGLKMLKFKISHSHIAHSPVIHIITRLSFAFIYQTAYLPLYHSTYHSTSWQVEEATTKNERKSNNYCRTDPSICTLAISPLCASTTPQRQLPHLFLLCFEDSAYTAGKYWDSSQLQNRIHVESPIWTKCDADIKWIKRSALIIQMLHWRINQLQ